MDDFQRLIIILASGAFILGSVIGLVGAYLSERKRDARKAEAN